MERQVGKSSPVMWVLKALLAAYLVTGALLGASDGASL